MKLKRVIYLGYYLKELDWDKFALHLNYTHELTERSKILILIDVLRSVFAYNISLIEYFLFRFYELSDQEKESWAGTGHMYEYQLMMNPLDNRHILENKFLFYKNYKDFFIHRISDIDELKNNPEGVHSLLSHSSGKLVLKSVVGQCGAQVEIINCSEFTPSALIEYMEEHNYGIVEEFIEQHPALNRLSPSAVNTVRVITELKGNGGIEILGCRLRISVDSPVDNMAAGNLAAPIGVHTGRVSGPAVYSDITKPEQEFHPVTNVKITGFQIPFWEETIRMVKEAALLHPQNRSIGWDVVITEHGPGLIEANHDWCKLLWQLPVNKGLKHELDSTNEENTDKKVFEKAI